MTLEQLENYKNKAIHFEQQRVINQVRQWVLQQALQEALGTLKSCLNNELHLRTASANIGMFGTMKEKITDYSFYYKIEYRHYFFLLKK